MMKLLLFLMIFVVFLLGILFINAEVPESWSVLGIGISKILPALGISFIIASILALTIDLFTRKAFFDECRVMMHDITKSVYAAILRKSLPEPIFREVEDNIFKYPFLREDYQISISLEEIKDQKIQQGTVEYNYWVLNLTDRQQAYPLKGIVSTDIKLSKKQLEERVFDLIKVTDEEDNIILEEKGPGIKQEKKHNELSFERKLKLPAGAKRKIELKYKNYYRYDDLFVALTPEPTIGFTVRVYHSEDFNIEGWALHSGGKGRFTQERKLNKLFECRLHGGVLPYHGILLVWRFKSNSAVIP